METTRVVTTHVATIHVATTQMAATQVATIRVETSAASGSRSRSEEEEASAMDFDFATFARLCRYRCLPSPQELPPSRYPSVQREKTTLIPQNVIRYPLRTK